MITEVGAPAHGGRGVVEVREGRPVEPAGDQVALAVRAVGVNPTDWKSADATWPRTEALVLGFEAAGEVTALGPGATNSGWQVGDEVIVDPVGGAYASQLLVSTDDLIRKPATLGFPQATNCCWSGPPRQRC